jgi:hypothetical protein
VSVHAAMAVEIQEHIGRACAEVERESEVWHFIEYPSGIVVDILFCLF